VEGYPILYDTGTFGFVAPTVFFAIAGIVHWFPHFEGSDKVLNCLSAKPGAVNGGAERSSQLGLLFPRHTGSYLFANL